MPKLKNFQESIDLKFFYNFKGVIALFEQVYIKRLTLNLWIFKTFAYYMFF